MKEKHILFVCKYNRFRSKVAEAWFKKLNRNPSLKAKSAGVIRGSPTDQETFAACRDAGIKIKERVEGLSTELLKWQDTIIIVADDVPPPLFENQKKYGKQIIVWKITDTHGSKKEMLPIIKAIEEKVRGLLGKLR